MFKSKRTINQTEFSKQNSQNNSLLFGDDCLWPLKFKNESLQDRLTWCCFSTEPHSIRTVHTAVHLQHLKLDFNYSVEKYNTWIKTWQLYYRLICSFNNFSKNIFLMPNIKVQIFLWAAPAFWSSYFSLLHCILKLHCCHLLGQRPPCTSNIPI